MSTFKKLLALTLALAMVLSVSAFAGYKTDTYKDAASIDEDCEDAIELMYALKIMQGDNNGNFNPTATITRAEIAKMIYVILNYGKDDKAVNYTGAKIFSDVPAGAWYEGYVNYCGTTKLVQGRGNGTFGPNDPVTTAEAAKMLLTAIGYSAEARGYTGANWDKNVLSDASIIGLLKGYNYPTTTYAPRQWVAVMFQNALLKALTFDTMRPSFNGLLISGNDAEGYDTMGKKYYGLSEFEAVAIATTNASIDKYDPAGTADDKEFASDYVLFSNGKEVKGTGLGAMDLGQEYRVIYNGKTAYSVRSLSETAEARLLDIEVEVKYGTSANKAQNKYEFTIDGMVAKFADKNINVLYTGTDDYADSSAAQTDAETLNVVDFYNLVTAPTRTNDIYKAIDADGDGDIDYMIVTEYAYAEITDDGTHNKYGDFITAQTIGQYSSNDVQAPVALRFNGESKLYLEDCIITDDEIVEDNVVKYTWDLDEGMLVMEVLPIAEDLVYEARDTVNKIYTLDGEDYQVADKGWYKELYTWLGTKDNLDEAVCIVYDGDLLVEYWLSDSDYTDIADINAQLVLVVDAENEYSNGTIREQPAIEYMTIDGETHVAVYQYKDGYVQFADIAGLGLDVYRGEENLKGRLFIIHEGTKGRVYLEELSNEGNDPNEQLDASTSLLNEYEILDGVTLDATGSAVKLNGNTMVADNPFFYAYDDDGEAAFGVITPAEFGDGYDPTTYSQTLNYVKSPSGRTTVLAGYVVVDLISDDTDNYLYITKIGRETADGVELTVQKLGAEGTETIYYDGDADLYENLLYSYTYYTMDDEYALSLVGSKDGDFYPARVVGWYDEEYYELYLDATFAANQHTLDVSDDDVVDDIVIVTIEYDRDETQTDDDDNDFLYSLYLEAPRTIEIVDYEDLAAEDIENGADTDSYEQSAYWYYDASADLVYVVVIRDMTVAQDHLAQQ